MIPAAPGRGPIDMEALLILVFTFSLGMSFLMSGMESGVFALNRMRVRQWMRKGNARAARLSGFLENPEPFLWTILVGNTLANLVAVSIGFLGMERWLGTRTVVFWSVSAVALVLFYALLELLPKMLFRARPDRLCLAVVPVFGVIQVVLRPMVHLVAFLASSLLRWSGGRRFTGQLFGNRDELRQAMQDSAQALTSEERVMINRVLDLQLMTVQQLARPIGLAVTIAADATMAETLALFREKAVSRLPVWQREGNRRRIIGLVTLKSLLYRTDLDLARKAADYVKPALFFAEDVRAEAALRQMQRTGQRLAIVLGRDQREVGLLSIEDILKVIFGEVNL